MASIRWEANSSLFITEFALAADELTTAIAVSNDQATELDLLGDFSLEFIMAAGETVTAGEALAELYIVRSIDGVNHEDVATGATATVAAGAFAGTFIAGAAAAADATTRNVVRGVVLPPEDFEVHLKDLSGHGMTFATLGILRYHYQSA
ncbi:MAG: hypothetical protein ACXAEN_14885 [Candidatus Thorarchaeota archaeon]|jgi:hypothetical protein